MDCPILENGSVAIDWIHVKAQIYKQTCVVYSSAIMYI